MTLCYLYVVILCVREFDDVLMDVNEIDKWNKVQTRTSGIKLFFIIYKNCNILPLLLSLNK